MTTQHTPGPWQFNDLDASIWPGPMGSRRAPVATVFTAAQPESELSQESDHFTPEEAANARLIAAAPELLAACIHALAKLECAAEKAEPGPQMAHWFAGEDYGLKSTIRAAIAKATGGAQ